jgi:hypothetical protein
MFASFFRIEEYAKQGNNMKQVESIKPDLVHATGCKQPTLSIKPC